MENFDATASEVRPMGIIQSRASGLGEEGRAGQRTVGMARDA